MPSVWVEDVVTVYSAGQRDMSVTTPSNTEEDESSAALTTTNHMIGMNLKISTDSLPDGGVSSLKKIQILINYNF